MVQIWRNLDPPGRFLIRTDPSLGDDSTWHDVGDKRARKKASQALREKERSEDLVATLAHSHGGIPGAASAVTASSAAGAASAAANANQNAGVDTINSRKRAKKQQFQPPTQVPPPAAAAIAAALPDATRHVAAGQQEVPLVDPMVAAQLLNLIAGGNLNQNQLPQLNSPPAPVPAPQPQRSALDPMLHSTLQLLAAANQNQNRFQTYGQDRLLASQLLENLGIRMNAQPTEQQGQQQSRNQTQ